MAKVILNKLAAADSPIYNQPHVIGGWFAKTSLPARNKPPYVGNVSVDEKLIAKPINGRKKNAR